MRILFKFKNGIPSSHVSQIKTVWDPERQTHVMASTSLRRHPAYLTLYVIWSKLIMTEIVPYLTILVLNVVIVAKTVKATTFRRQFGSAGGGGRSSAPVSYVERGARGSGAGIGEGV